MATINLRKSNRGYEQVSDQYEQDCIQQDTVPLPSAPAYEWADYCNRARGKAASALIEWGRRIQEAHDAYKAQDQQWGRTWDDWCQQNLGISKSHAHKLVSIGEHFVNSFHAVKQILPADTAVLYGLARLKKDHPAVFEQEVEAGTISPELNRKVLKEIMDRCYPKQQKTRSKPPSVSLRVEQTVAELLQHRAQQEGVSVTELLMELLTKP